ncbi:MAG: thioredoxin domain-containing protein [Candidatus Woesearchaeota archaeon]
MKITMLFSYFFMFILMLGLLLIISCTSSSGKYDAFAKSLTEKGAVMYGTEWCSHCKAQKALFGSSFQYINFVDCDKEQSKCIAAGVEGYPTWSINGKLYPGTQSLADLSTYASVDII